MTFLIGQLAVWLLLTAAFAGLAGWAFAATRAQPIEFSARRARDRLMRDLLAIGIDSAVGPSVPVELDREMDSLRRRADLNAARVLELERALEAARARAEDEAGKAAELQRAVGQDASESEELTRLRAEMAAIREEQSRTLDVEAAPEAPAAPAPQDEPILQAWQSRYLEQRVRYLETQVRDAPPAGEIGGEEFEERARVAEARVAQLEEEVRALIEGQNAAPAAEVATDSPFASNAEVDTLLRWRMLYLEKRVGHLQEQAPMAPISAGEIDAEEAEKWKWRARYLEARVRHLESQPVRTEAPGPTPLQQHVAELAPVESIQEEAEPAPPAPLVPAGAEQRPPALAAARGGAPDDFTLIEGVSLLQQTTLNSLGIYHFEQIAAWTPANVAWVDQYLRLRGRISEEEWVEQAEDLAELGPAAARRLIEDEAL